MKFRFGSPILNISLFIVILLLGTVLVIQYQHGEFIRSGEVTLLGTITGQQESSCPPKIIGCLDTPDYFFQTNTGLHLYLALPDPGDAMNPKIVSFLNKAIVGFNGSLVGKKAEVKGYLDGITKTITVSQDGDYIHEVK